MGITKFFFINKVIVGSCPLLLGTLYFEQLIVDFQHSIIFFV